MRTSLEKTLVLTQIHLSQAKTASKKGHDTPAHADFVCHYKGETGSQVADFLLTVGSQELRWKVLEDGDNPELVALCRIAGKPKLQGEGEGEGRIELTLTVTSQHLEQILKLCGRLLGDDLCHLESHFEQVQPELPMAGGEE